MNDSPGLQSALDGLVIEALAEDLDLVVSYALSGREAALRGDAKLVVTHVAQLRLCIIEALSKCRQLAAVKEAPP